MPWKGLFHWTLNPRIRILELPERAKELEIRNRRRNIRSTGSQFRSNLIFSFIFPCLFDAVKCTPCLHVFLYHDFKKADGGTSSSHMRHPPWVFIRLFTSANRTDVRLWQIETSFNSLIMWTFLKISLSLPRRMLWRKYFFYIPPTYSG